MCLPCCAAMLRVEAEIMVSLNMSPDREPSYFRLGRTILRSHTP